MRTFLAFVLFLSAAVVLASTPAFAQGTCATNATAESPTGTITVDSTGTFKALIIFAKFPDGEEVLDSGLAWPRCTCGADDWVPTDLSPPDWADSLIEGSTPPLIEGSLTDFFYTWSQGKHSLVGDILDTVLVVDSTIAYYDTTFSTFGIDTGPVRAANLNVLAQADSLVDFSQYDANGDAIVDYVFIYYQSGNTWDDTIPKFYTVNQGFSAVSLITISDYTTMDQDSQQRTMTIPWNGGSTVLQIVVPVSGPPTLVQHRWYILELFAHEYGHDLLGVARINILPSPYNGDHLFNASRYTIMHGTLPSGLMMHGFVRHKLNWIDPPVIRATTIPFDTTFTLSASYLDHDGTFAIIEPDPALVANAPQYFLLEAKRDNLPGETYNARLPNSACCYPTLQNDRGLLITHVVDSASYKGTWTTTTIPTVDNPPVIDIEVARGAFDTTDASPDPIAGLTNIRNLENLGLGGFTARSHDLFTPQKVGGEQRSNAFTPWTNPNTNLYDDGTDSQVPNWHQTVYSGISIYDIEWTSANEESIRVKVRFDNPTPPAGADTIHVDTTLQGLVQLTGDLVVGPSATVTVLEDAQIVAATTDRFNAGRDGGNVEVIVPGDLQVVGGDSAVVITSSRDDGFTHWMIVPGIGALDTFNYQGEVTAAAPGDWRGFRMQLQGAPTGYGYDCSGTISEATISYADKAIALEGNCAPSISAVRFLYNNMDILLDSTDVFVPYTNPWDIDGPALIVARNATKMGQDYSPGHAGKVDLIVQGLLTTSGTAADSVRFRPEFPTDADGDDWGGIYMDWTASGSQVEYAEISHAATPLFFYYNDGSAVRHSTVHHFKDVGMWFVEALGSGAIVDSNLVQRDDTTNAGDNLGIDHGNLGILFEKSGPLHVQGNAVIMKGMDNLTGGAGIEIRNGTAWCQAAPSSVDSVQVVQNRLVGPGKSAPIPTLWSGVDLNWACGPGPRLVYVSENNVTDWNEAGIYLTQSSDVQVSCNTVKSNRRNVDFTRTDPFGDNVRFRQNTLEAQSLQAIRTDRADKMALGPDATSTGDNLIKVTGAVGKFIHENDPDNGHTLNAVANQWYINGTLNTNTTTILARMGKDSGAQGTVLVDVSSPKQTPATPSCSIPAMAFSGPGIAAAPEAERPTVERLAATGLPDRTGLEVVGPSPFRTETALNLAVAEPLGGVKLRIYDVQGRLVRELADRDFEPGRYRVHWDGRGGSGDRVGSGIYFVRLEAGRLREVRKVVRIQ